ncbi:glycosyltransferase family 2 protein [Kocuria arenosa]|uniref:glycosyltransferase family 2 protein n=1 Tax=Kocuria arenosa TaxID=3071446 RepID=UPI0034D650C9
MIITALIPAHNEAANVGLSIGSLHGQTRPPDRIIVISDNSTDSTVEVARGAGADVMESVGNTARKAGALNQALAGLELSSHDFVLVMDADTQLSPTFIERALVDFRDSTVGAVGAVFDGVQPQGYLQYMQRLEWARYAESIDRTRRTFVLSGTAALIRWQAIGDVHQIFGRYYEERSITEDMRMTMDLKIAGWRLTSPVDCQATTEMMPTVLWLFRQRRRWYLGALQNVTAYGLTSVSMPYWRQQMMLSISVALMTLFLVLTALSVALGWFVLNPFWMAIGVVFAVERVVTIWSAGWRARLTAALVLPELVFALILQSAFVAAFHQHLTRQTGSWHHLEGVSHVRN